jgi:hypothetical protein
MVPLRHSQGDHTAVVLLMGDKERKEKRSFLHRNIDMKISENYGRRRS